MAIWRSPPKKRINFAWINFADGRLEANFAWINFRRFAKNREIREILSTRKFIHIRYISTLFNPPGKNLFVNRALTVGL